MLVLLSAFIPLILTGFVFWYVIFAFIFIVCYRFCVAIGAFFFVCSLSFFIPNASHHFGLVFLKPILCLRLCYKWNLKHILWMSHTRIFATFTFSSSTKLLLCGLCVSRSRSIDFIDRSCASDASI